MAVVAENARLTLELPREPEPSAEGTDRPGLFSAAAFLSVLISVAIVLSLAGGAFDFLRKVPLAALWSDGWFPRHNLFDIKTIVAGTLIVAGIAMIVAVRSGSGPRCTSRSTPRPGPAGR